MPWGDSNYTATPSGTDLKLRREEVGISQALLAWAARVSRNTVGNLERSQGEPEDRVVKNVCAALGVKSKWRMGFDAPEDASHILFSADAVKRLYEIIVDDIQPKNSKRARQAIDAFRELMATEDRELFERADLGLQTTRFADYLAPHMEPEDQLLREAFIERGWSPEDSERLTMSGLAEEMRADLRSRRSSPELKSSEGDATLKEEVSALRQRVDEMTEVADSMSSLIGASPEDTSAFRELIRGGEVFRRLPVRLQAALLQGYVADHARFEYQVSDVSIPLVALVVRPDDASGVSALEIAKAVSYWTMTLALAQALVNAGEKQGLDMAQTVLRVQEFLHTPAADEAEIMEQVDKLHEEDL
jgi:transcriptional regulator with XRE-family HTH domain